MRITIGLIGIYLMTASTAHAEIQKTATPCVESGKQCVYWWPKLAVPAGWHLDKKASLENEMNIFVPDGFNYSNAGTFIYAKARNKHEVTVAKSIQQLIDSDIEEFREHAPNVDAKEVEPLPIASGEKLRSITFFPSPNKPPGRIRNWDRVVYAEESNEGEQFFICIILSARTIEGYKSAEGIYKKLLLSYKK